MRREAEMKRIAIGLTTVLVVAGGIAKFDYSPILIVPLAMLFWVHVRNRRRLGIASVLDIIATMAGGIFLGLVVKEFLVLQEKILWRPWLLLALGVVGLAGRVLLVMENWRIARNIHKSAMILAGAAFLAAVAQTVWRDPGVKEVVGFVLACNLIYFLYHEYVGGVWTDEYNDRPIGNKVSAFVAISTMWFLPASYFLHIPLNFVVGITPAPFVSLWWGVLVAVAGLILTFNVWDVYYVEWYTDKWKRGIYQLGIVAIPLFLVLPQDQWPVWGDMLGQLVLFAVFTICAKLVYD